MPYIRSETIHFLINIIVNHFHVSWKFFINNILAPA